LFSVSSLLIYSTKHPFSSNCRRILKVTSFFNKYTMFEALIILLGSFLLTRALYKPIWIYVLLSVLKKIFSIAFFPGECT